MLGKKKNYFLTGIIGIITKTLVIYGNFWVLNVCGIFPSKLVNNLQVAMGTTQLITACIGMVITFVLYKIEKEKFTKESQ